MSQHAVYLTFNGNCEEALDFYHQCLGGKIEFIQRYEESPMESSEAWKKKIMHSTLDLNGFKLMMADGPEGHEGRFGTNISIALNFDSEDQIEKAFSEMSDGGQVTMALQDTFWGATFGMCTDKFGMNWMFNYDNPRK